MPNTRRYCYDYPRPMVTVDAVLLRIRDGQLQTLLIKRAAPPHKGKWALPGGFIKMKETLEQSALREVAEETGLARIPFLTKLNVYGDPGRDPRGRVITVAFLGILSGDNRASAGDDAAALQWTPVNALPDTLAFDHNSIINDALELVANRAAGDEGVFDFLPKSFTVEQLQQALDAIFLDKVDAREYLRYFLDNKLARRLPGGKKFRFNISLSE